ncbi:hypothetical protein SQ11_15850 [Nitrosospira sp. NpAV]|nr:hypothetical protein SQ11_15850 [Nitrosospira sp. NpAV]
MTFILVTLLHILSTFPQWLTTLFSSENLCNLIGICSIAYTQLQITMLLLVLLVDVLSMSVISLATTISSS